MWVARGKHAHYPSREACDRGNWQRDTCDGSAAASRFNTAGDGRNIGSRALPFGNTSGCVHADLLVLGDDAVAPDAAECLWDARRSFRGWRGAAMGPAPRPYAELLARYAGW